MVLSLIRQMLDVGKLIVRVGEWSRFEVMMPIFDASRPDSSEDIECLNFFHFKVRKKKILKPWYWGSESDA